MPGHALELKPLAQMPCFTGPGHPQHAGVRVADIHVGVISQVGKLFGAAQGAGFDSACAS